MALDGDTQQLEMAFCSDYIGTANNARYSDQEMDDLFAQARTETDTDAREKIFDQILTKAQNEAIYAVLANPLTLYAHNVSLDCQEIPFEGIYSIYNFSWK
jgi:peptide/nickel transport system substrate-binding protein